MVVPADSIARSRSRSAPAVTAASCGQLARDATFDADARRGAWLRVAPRPPHSRGGWVLVSHPVHGTLVEAV